MDNIIWKPVVGYEGVYEVSNTGLIRRVLQYNFNYPRVLKPIDTHGYYKVTLSKNNIKQQRTIHRIVAEAFLPNPDNLEMVNHKDENGHNNNVNNLEWCTRAYNQLYSIGLHPERKQLFAKNFKNSSSWTKRGVAHKNIQKVAIIDDDNNIIRTFENASVAGKELGIVPGNIIQACKVNANPPKNKQRQIGRKRRASGHIFVYLED